MKFLRCFLDSQDGSTKIFHKMEVKIFFKYFQRFSRFLKLLFVAFAEMLKNRHLPALPSEDQVSGSFDSLTSSSEEDTPSQSEKKPRSSSGPPAYNIKYQEQLSLDRRISGSLTRQQEKTKFFSDPDAVHCGILHQRRVLAVWQKRYCKVKNATLLCYRYEVSVREGDSVNSMMLIELILYQVPQTSKHSL